MNLTLKILLLITFLSSLAYSRVYHINDDVDNDVTILDRTTMTSNLRRERRSFIKGKEEIHEFSDQINSSHYVFPQDSNNIAFVFWKYAYAKMVFILTCQEANTTNYNKLSNKGCNSKSRLYRSKDHGGHFEFLNNTFQNDHLHSIYISPVDTSYITLTDYKNKTMFISTDHGLIFKKHRLSFSPTFLYFHPTLVNYVAAFDNTPKGDNALYISQDSGQTWQLISKRVRNYFWAQNSQDQNSTKIYLEVGIGKQINVNLLASLLYASDTPYKTLDKVHQYDLVPFSLYVGDQFIIIQNWLDKNMYLSYGNRINLNMMIYDKQRKDHLHHVILNSKNNELLMGIIHPDQTATLYLSASGSSSNVLKFVQDNILMEHMKHAGLVPKMDFYQVKGLYSTYITNKKQKGTLISFDKGHNWLPLNYKSTSDDKCNGKCQLTLYIKMDIPFYEFTAPLLSKSSAPGIIIAQGYLGNHINNQKYGSDHQVYLSTDGGYTWARSLDSSYGFTLLDHGGLIAATPIKYTFRHFVHFTTDYGQTWYTKNLTQLYSRIAAIITESTAKSLMINVFGFLQKDTGADIKGDTWIVWKFDFSGLFSRECSEATDFIDWQHHPKCVLGEIPSTKKRLPQKSCIVGPDFKNVVKRKQCKCTWQDFECEDLYDRKSTTAAGYECIPINKNHTIMKKCQNSDVYYETKGYRKLYGDVCIDGVSKEVQPVKKTCPVVTPGNIRFKVSPGRQGVGAPVVAEILSFEGSTYKTTLSWYFGDNSAPTQGPFEKTKKVQTKYYRHGLYNITVIASNSKGRSATSRAVIIYDDLYYDAFLFVEEPLVVNVSTEFALKKAESENTLETLKPSPAVVFIWSFGGVYLAGMQSASANYLFPRTGWFKVEVSILSTFNHRLISRQVRVYSGAVTFDVSFSNALDYYNTKSKAWMVDFTHKFKMFLAIKYDIHDNDRIFVRGKPQIPTQVTVTLVDSEDTMNSADGNANYLATKIVNGINQGQPLLHGFASQDVHVVKASHRHKIKQPTTAPSVSHHHDKAWIYVVVILIILIGIGVLIAVYQYRRKGNFQFWKKHDGMKSTLFSDVDDELGTYENEERTMEESNGHLVLTT